MVTWWWSPRAIRPSAERGSPCEPVDTSTTCSGGIAAASSSDTMSPGATCRRPRSRATPMLRTIDRPTKATLRPCVRAQSSTCWMRCTWLAELETIRPRGGRGETAAGSGGGGGAGEDVVEDRADAALGCDEPGHLRVGGVRQQQVDAGQPEPGEGAEVGEDAVQRELVHLEVAGVHERPRGRVHGDGEGVGDRVVDRDELAVERP